MTLIELGSIRWRKLSGDAFAKATPLGEAVCRVKPTAPQLTIFFFLHLIRVRVLGLGLGLGVGVGVGVGRRGRVLGLGVFWLHV